MVDSDFETMPIGTAQRLLDLEAALQPFADFADPRGTLPPGHQITQGSPMARRQLTMGDCYAARNALQAKGCGQ